MTFIPGFIKRYVKRSPSLHAWYLRRKWRKKGPKEKDLRFLTQLKYRVVVDVGGNVGEYAWFLSPRAEQINTFEPNESCRRVINCLSLSNLRLHSLALGKIDGALKLNVPVAESGEVSALGTTKSILPDAAGHSAAIVSYEIPVRRFDGIDLGRCAEIDLVKVDVEGAESDVLAGMEGFLRQHSPLLLVEIEARRNPDWKDVFDRLEALGFSPYVTFDGRRLSRVATDYVAVQPPKGSGGRRYIFNYFFLRDETAARMKDYIELPAGN